MSTHVETLGELDLYQHVEVTVDDGTTVSGRAGPIDYVPGESLRVEVEPEDGENVRYQFRADREEGEWEDVVARRITPDRDDWEDLGIVTGVEPEATEGERGDAAGAGK